MGGGGGKQCLFCEHEGLGLISSMYVKKPGVTLYAYNPSAGRYRQTDPSFTSLVCSRPVRLYFKKQVEWLLRLSSDFYTNVHTCSCAPVCKQTHMRVRTRTHVHTPKKKSVVLIGCGFQTLLSTLCSLLWLGPLCTL